MSSRKWTIHVETKDGTVAGFHLTNAFIKHEPAREQFLIHVLEQIIAQLKVDLGK